VSGSIDQTCKLWDVRNGTCLKTFSGHEDEILDVAFNMTGTKLVTASADGTSRLYSICNSDDKKCDRSSSVDCGHYRKCSTVLKGHDGEISQICFNPQGTRILTAGIDKTARLWNTETGECLQILEGHNDEIFSCTFNYHGDTIITGSKDNTCRIWKC